jgi:hypothetical protein
MRFANIVSAAHWWKLFKAMGFIRTMTGGYAQP